MYQIINGYLSCFITVLGVVIFGRMVLNTKIKIPKFELILMFLFATLVYTYDFLCFNSTIKTIIMFLTNVILYRVLFKISYAKAILLNFLYSIILILPDMIELFFVIKILNISIEDCYATMAGSLLSNIRVFVFLMVITFISRNMLKKVFNYKIEDNIKLIMFSILTFICISIFLYLMNNEYRNGNNIVEYLVVMIISLSILISLIKQTLENERLTKRYDKILEFMTTYEEEVEKQRTLRHETKNEFLNIKGQIIENNDKDKILSYINSILNDQTKIKFEEYAKFQFLPPNGIKGLCYFKVQEAQTKDIVVGINISSQIETSNIYKLDIKQQRNFGKILGVFLDNAIEASSLTEEKQLGIEAYNKDGEFQMIISNTYNNDIDKEKIGKEKFSTKGKNRGHGLLLVKNIVENHNVFEVKTETNNNLYIQYIKIKESI